MVSKQALAIGINAYEPSSLALRPCINDANDLSSSLRSIGFRAHSTLDLDLDSMKSVTRQFIHSIQPGAVVVFYFSGHGVQCNGNNYLIPKDARGVSADNIQSTAIDAQKLIEDMYLKKPKVVICILDCCRTNAPVDPLDGFSPYKKALAGTRPGLAPMRAPPSSIVVYACAADDTASARSKNGRNSLYTYHLLRYIKTPNVDVETVLKQVAINVQRDSNNGQIPYRYSSCNELIYLTSRQGHKAPALPQYIQPKPVVQPPLNKQHGKVPAIHHPQPQHNMHRHQHQLNGHFGLPVYQYLAVQNKSPYAQRIPLGHVYVAPTGVRYHQR